MRLLSLPNSYDNEITRYIHDTFYVNHGCLLPIYHGEDGNRTICTDYRKYNDSWVDEILEQALLPANVLHPCNRLILDFGPPHRFGKIYVFFQNKTNLRAQEGGIRLCKLRLQLGGNFLRHLQLQHSTLSQ